MFAHQLFTCEKMTWFSQIALDEGCNELKMSLDACCGLSWLIKDVPHCSLVIVFPLCSNKLVTLQGLLHTGLHAQQEEATTWSFRTSPSLSFLSDTYLHCWN